MDMPYGKDKLMRKLAIYEFGCRNILYLMLTRHFYLLSILEKVSRNDMLFWNSKAKHPTEKTKAQKEKKRKKGRNLGETSM